MAEERELIMTFRYNTSDISKPKGGTFSIRHGLISVRLSSCGWSREYLPPADAEVFSVDFGGMIIVDEGRTS